MSCDIPSGISASAVLRVGVYAIVAMGEAKGKECRGLLFPMGLL